MDFLPELTFGTEFNLNSRETISLEEEENIFRQVILQGALWHKPMSVGTTSSRPLGFKDRDGD